MKLTGQIKVTFYKWDAQIGVSRAIREEDHPITINIGKNSATITFPMLDYYSTEPDKVIFKKFTVKHDGKMIRQEHRDARGGEWIDLEWLGDALYNDRYELVTQKLWIYTPVYCNWSEVFIWWTDKNGDRETGYFTPDQKTLDKLIEVSAV